jgi:hypothetical protein
MILNKDFKKTYGNYFFDGIQFAICEYINMLYIKHQF